MIDTIIAFSVGVWVGGMAGFVIAGLFGGNHDEDLPDQ